MEIPLSSDLTSLHLDLLRVSDPYIIKNCIVQSLSTCFTYGHDVLKGLQLDKLGLVSRVSGDASLMMCSPCHSALTHNKLPALALANRLYRGSLPSQFSDLTWIEEKVCAIYSITAHVTRLFQSSDPTQPKVFHGNTCAHDMNIMSTASVLPRAPADINGFLSVVFIGPEAFDPKRMGTLFRVRKHKIWTFLQWLKAHNHLYADIPLDETIMDLYPSDGTLPGLDNHVVVDHKLNPQAVFASETSGFSGHPASLMHDTDPADITANLESAPVLVEKMGVSDPECDKLSG
ncbi:uncharacterized protein EDB91DRAFT_1226155 [Suillus paluster]|uniref:uncharacterized protein n=1 Tax=Suillus paluster TaxID=48578 RepID=UPI001B87B9F3|nr:uncharacterized protein EDB91DRAFT_1226155 [Suillus paluster]KAG1733187.1 hypothetical protein EDB91DRAFT_1226155 [Suillus paluster]